MEKRAPAVAIAGGRRGLLLLPVRSASRRRGEGKAMRQGAGRAALQVLAVKLSL
jgi:hypothetical protein